MAEGLFDDLTPFGSITKRTGILRNHAVYGTKEPACRYATRQWIDEEDSGNPKRFAQARYETDALAIDEQLLDDRVFKE